MSLHAPIRAIRNAAAWTALLLCTAGAQAARILPDFLVNEPSHPGAYQTSPVSASNGSVFLVVWTEFLADSRIMAARVRASDGLVLDPQGLFIATFESYQTAPMVASDGKGFLIVWEDLRGATGSDVIAARVSTTDAAAPTVQVAALVSADGDQMFPAVASNGDGYFVAWEDVVGGASANIKGGHLDAADAGAVLAPPGGFTVQNGGFPKFRPVTASNGRDYLLAWEDARNGDLDVYATRVDSSGTALLDAQALPVGRAASVQTNLAIASNGRDYLVAWEDYRMGSESDIYAARVLADGSVPDPVGVTLTSAASYQIFPTAASSGGDYLVAWEDYGAAGGGVTDVLGARVNSLDGTLLETDQVFAAPGQSQFLPALASVEGRYLVAYQDMGPTGEFRIRGQFAEFDEDRDRDGVRNRLDNCPETPNPDQLDTDGDGLGQPCDPDDENDGVPDVADNCPLMPNPGQEDHDGDGLGDACDPDDDNDGALDGADNCADLANPGQEDNDADGLGDLCDPDDDNDAVADGTDNCPLMPNTGQVDRDGDGKGDACDPLLEVALDIVPGDPYNRIPMGCGQSVRVVVLGTARFDVKGIDPATVRFAGAVPKRNERNALYTLVDVNRDGKPDMQFKFRNDQLDLKRTDTMAELKGLMKDGMPFAGRDKVKVSR